jgi:hypothetical protein
MGALLTIDSEKATLISNGYLLFIGKKNTEHWPNLTI